MAYVSVKFDSLKIYNKRNCQNYKSYSQNNVEIFMMLLIMCLIVAQSLGPVRLKLQAKSYIDTARLLLH